MRPLPGIFLASSLAFFAAACGGADAPAGSAAPEPDLILSGPAGVRELPADGSQRRALLAELDSLLAAEPLPLFLAVEPAAVAAARGAGALEIRWRRAQRISLADQSVVKPTAILIPLTQAPEALAVGAESTLLLLLDGEGRLLTPLALKRPRAALRTLLSD